jgi:hypothetical protein
MFASIRKRLTWANVAMTLALVFAMSGGAYAAKRYLITSTKQISPKVLKTLQGKAGPAGAPGTQGPVGATGKDGAPGSPGEKGAPGESVAMKAAAATECKKEGGVAFTVGGKTAAACNGKEGKTGESVTNTALAKGDAHCEEGGAELKVGGGTPTYACTGSPWPAGGTLPKGATEKGVWAVNGLPQGFEGLSTLLGSISFTIPLAAALDAAHVNVVPEVAGATGTGDLTSGSEEVKNVSASNGVFNVGAEISGAGIPAGTTITRCLPACKGNATELVLSAPAAATATGVALTAAVPAVCTGTLSDPGAVSGHLCLFEQYERNVKNIGVDDAFFPFNVNNSASVSGAQLYIHAENETEKISSAGTWAVTG